MSSRGGVVGTRVEGLEKRKEREEEGAFIVTTMDGLNNRQGIRRTPQDRQPLQFPTTARQKTRNTPALHIEEPSNKSTTTRITLQLSIAQQLWYKHGKGSFCTSKQLTRRSEHDHPHTNIDFTHTTKGRSSTQTHTDTHTYTTSRTHTLGTYRRTRQHTHPHTFSLHIQYTLRFTVVDDILTYRNRIRRTPWKSRFTRS